MDQLAYLNWIDIVIITVVLLSAMFGMWRGLVKEVLSLVTWIAALVVARVYSDDFAPFFMSRLENETTRVVAAFALLFLATLLVGTLLNHLMTGLISAVGLKLTDRLLGAGFGFARGGLLVMLTIFVGDGFFADIRGWQQSQLIPYGRQGIQWSRMFIDDVYQPDPLIETSSPASVLSR